MALHQDTDAGPSSPSKPWKEKGVENAEVAEPGLALAAILKDLGRIGTLLQGTDAMREAGREYLPQHPYEPNKAYNTRLAVAVLDNYTERTLNTLVGKAMADPPAPGEDMPEAIVDLLDDVDDAGTGLVPFARDWFREGVRGSEAHVLIDATQPAMPDGSIPATKADDAKVGMRPSWRLISADDMLDLQKGKVKGLDGRVRVLPTVVRFRDDELRPKGDFGVELVERVKVFRQQPDGVYWEAWELVEVAKKKRKWVQVTPPTAFGLKTIPLVTFKTGERPPLSALAHLNVTHWQSSADQRNIVTVARFPILAASGVREAEGAGEAGQIVVGPNQFLTTPDPQSKIYYVEHNGAAIESGRNDLKDLEQAMAAYGAQFMEKGAQGPETASGRVLDEAEAISPIKAWGLDFKDCLELACWYTAQWLGLGEVDTPVDFEVEEEVDLANPTEVQSLDAARERKDISRDAWIKEAQLRGIIKQEGYDAEKDMDLIEDEPPPPGGGLAGMTKGLAGAKGAPKPPAK